MLPRPYHIRALFIALALSSCATRSGVHYTISTLAEDTPQHEAAPWTGRAMIYVLADNQERELLGAPSFYSEIYAHKLSKVAIRSLEQDLQSKFVVQQAFNDIAERHSSDVAPTILHLGDLLDYGCTSEFDKLEQMSWPHTPNFFLAPGNHDVVFQGNASYGGVLGAKFLTLRKLFNDSIDPTLDGHHNEVCRRRGTLDLIPPQVQELAKSARYLTIPKVRKHSTVRQLPQTFRCQYLRLKSGTRGIAESSIRHYCDDAQVFSYYEVEKAPDGLKQAQLSLSHTGHGSALASISAGPSLNDWNRGHLVQKVRVPLRQGNESFGFVELILLDTTDWSYKPSWAFWQVRGDAAQGAVSKQQQQTIDRWLNEAAIDPAVKGVIFAGHYPGTALDPDTWDWLLRSQERPKVLPLFVSAHTHEGHEAEISAVEGTGTVRRFKEINVGSLTDYPVHYRNLEVLYDEKRQAFSIRSQVYRMENRCNRTDTLRHAHRRGFESAGQYLSASEEFHFDPIDQWCVRLAHSNKILSRHDAKFEGVSLAECKSTGPGPFVQQYANAELRMMQAAATDAGLLESLACEAIGGAQRFRFSDSTPKSVSMRFVSRNGRWQIEEWSSRK